MEVQRCKKCGSIYEVDNTNCPTCGIRNNSRKMFDVDPGKRVYFDYQEPVQTKRNNKEDARGIRILPLVLFAIVALPFVVIWELVKERSAKR